MLRVMAGDDQERADYLVIEVRLQAELPPETPPEPVRRELQVLAARLTEEANLCGAPEVRLLTPDDPDSVIEYAHLYVLLRLVYHDVLGHEDVRSQVAGKLAQIRAVRDGGHWPHLAKLSVSDIIATMLSMVKRMDWYGERLWRLTERGENV
jgi:hypothetical protein